MPSVSRVLFFAFGCIIFPTKLAGKTGPTNDFQAVERCAPTAQCTAVEATGKQTWENWKKEVVFSFNTPR